MIEQMKENARLLDESIYRYILNNLRFCQTAMIWDEWVHRFTIEESEDDWVFWAFLEPVFKVKENEK